MSPNVQGSGERANDAVIMKFLYLLSVVFHLAAGCTLSGDNKWLDIKRHEGDSVLLPCSCADLHSKPQNFSWESYRTKHRTEVLNDEQYSGRLQLFNNISPANLSLLISDLREEDEGDFHCRTEKESRSFLLFVKGCELVNSWEIVDVTGFTGESVVLPCVCTDLQDNPKTVRWEFNFQEIYPKQTGHHRNRAKLVNKNCPGNLSLLISDLTEEDQGFYKCSVRSNWTYVSLNINGKRESSTSSREKDTAPALAQPQNKTTISSPALSSTTQNETISNKTTYLCASSKTAQVLSFLLVLLLLISGAVAFICWSCKGRRSGEYLITNGHLDCKGKQKYQEIYPEHTGRYIQEIPFRKPQI